MIDATVVLERLEAFETQEEKTAYLMAISDFGVPPRFRISSLDQGEDGSWVVGWEFVHKDKTYGAKVAGEPRVHVTELISVAMDHAEASWKQVKKND